MRRNQNLSGSNDSLKKGAWTETEDQILIDYVKKNGEGKWERVQKHTGLRRCGKSCRLRWLNYLRPNIKRGNISNDEEELIIRLHKLLGNRWSLIAGRLPGRTDNEIKNYWNSKLRKKLQLGGKPPKNSKSKRSNSAIKDAAARVEAVEDHLLDRAQEAYIVNPEGPIRNSVAMLGDEGGSAFPVAGDGCSWDPMVDCKVGGDSSLSEFLDFCLMGVGEACTQMASSSQHENMFDQPCVHSPSEDLIKLAGDLSEEMLSKWAAELMD